MNKIKTKKKNIYLIIFSLFIAVMMTFSNSLAKYHFKTEYKLNFVLTESFTFSAGETHTFIAPYYGYYAFQLWGGNGGESKNEWNGGHDIYELGGEGGKVSAVSYFQEGDILIVTVGTKGGITVGGFNGGGNGGIDTSNLNNNYYGGGGGGATDVRFYSNSLNYRILVAGGGGGGGSLNQIEPGYQLAYGGNGGNEKQNFLGANGLGEGNGGGATYNAGGAGYQNGSLGNGGNSQYSGGGGGHYGGGSSYGPSGGGGGGSSYIDNNFKYEVPKGLPDRSKYGANEQDGFAIISFLGE